MTTPITILIILGILVCCALLGGFIVLIVRLTPGRQESRNRRRGRYGESLVRAELGEDREGVRRVLTNYCFYHGGKVREIDHVVIDARGVFVIETKNWSGDIYGGDNDEKWTQVLGKGDIVHYHENPVKQNKGHIYHLKSVLAGVLPQKLWLNSLVVFVQNNVEHIASESVVPLAGLKVKLDGYPSGQLSPKSIERIYQALLAARYR